MWRLRNVCCGMASIMVLMQFFSSFALINGIELPLELLHEGVNGAKSMDFARRMAFPLATSDNGVEMPPPTVEDNMDLNDGNEGDLDNEEFSRKSEMPKWLQMQLQPEMQQHNNYHHQHSTNMLPKHKQSGFKHHSSSSSSSSSAASSPLKRCNIEISSKIPGICQSMGSIGTACVSGDYIDVFNAQCL